MPAAAAIITAVATYKVAKMQTKNQKESAHLQTQSANYAADIQAKATADALAAEREQVAYERQQFEETQRYEREKYEAQQRARAPYVTLSNNAFSKLSDLLGVQAPSFQPPQPSGMYAPPQAQQQAPGMGMAPPQGLAPPQPQGTNLAALLGPSGGRAPLYPSAPALTQADDAAAGAPPATDGGTIRMQAPTGEIRDVPRSQMNRYLQRGARVVGVS